MRARASGAVRNFCLFLPLLARCGRASFSVASHCPKSMRLGPLVSKPANSSERATTLSLLILLASLSLSQADTPRIRGVHPAVASKYSFANGLFTCLDGSKRLSSDKVNDDFCDCIDGSDEPGVPESILWRLSTTLH